MATRTAAPGNGFYFAAVATAGRDLDEYQASREEEHRERFLTGMSELVLLLCDWVEQNDGVIPALPEDVQTTMSRCLTVRNELLGYRPAAGTVQSGGDD